MSEKQFPVGSAYARRLFILLLLALPAVARAQFRYYTNNGTITIFGYTGPGGAVVIPATIHGLPVTGIGNTAFYEKPNLSSITIPDSVTSIGEASFRRCTSLSSITVDPLNPVYSSVDGVLFNKSQTLLIVCPEGKVGSYTIPNSVTGIRYEAFQSCASLTSVTIPDGVTSIGNNAFVLCTSLSAITVDALNFVYSSLDGVLFNKSQTLLIKCPEGKVGSYTIPNSVAGINSGAFIRTRLTSVTIPNGVTSIGTFAFASCTSLTSVALPYNVTNIEEGTFSFCTSLTNVALPNSVTSIGIRAFYSCTSLSSITIPSHVTSIGAWAFYLCTSLNNVAIPNGVTNIGNAAFYLCSSLTNVDIPNSVTRIGDSAFAVCTSLTSATIPHSVTSIGNSPYFYCTNLSAITVDALNSSYHSVDGVLFNKSQTLLIQYPGGKSGSYTIPNSVNGVGDYAFAFCFNLTSATIPNSVTNIGNSAFAFCTSLTGVYFQGNVPGVVGFDVFLGANNAMVYYLPGTTGWGATFAGRPAVLWQPQAESRDPSFGVRTNRFGFAISWADNRVVVVEATTNLANADWTPVGTNTLTGGSSYFSDSQWTNHRARFYRLRSPQ